MCVSKGWGGNAIQDTAGRMEGGGDCNLKSPKSVCMNSTKGLLPVDPTLAEMYHC